MNSFKFQIGPYACTCIYEQHVRVHTYLTWSDSIYIHVLEGVEEVSVGHHAFGCLPVHLLEASHDHHTLTHCLHLLRRLGKGSIEEGYYVVSDTQSAPVLEISLQSRLIPDEESNLHNIHVSIYIHVYMCLY